MPYQNPTFLMSAQTISGSDPGCIQVSVALLRQGGLICYPTDTVYGIGGAAGNDEAVRRVYEAKGRPLGQPMPLLIADPEDAARFASLNETGRRLIDQFWPGGLTLVMPKAEGFHSLALAGQETVGLRLPDQDTLRAVIRELGEPLVGTSANRSGTPPATTAQEAAGQIGEAVDLIIDGGECTRGEESTVLDITTEPPRVLRWGTVSRLDIEGVLGRSIRR